MTGDDISNGIMRITVLVAITRPAELSKSPSSSRCRRVDGNNVLILEFINKQPKHKRLWQTKMELHRALRHGPYLNFISAWI